MRDLIQVVKVQREKEGFLVVVAMVLRQLVPAVELSMVMSWAVVQGSMVPSVGTVVPHSMALLSTSSPMSTIHRPIVHLWGQSEVCASNWRHL